MVCNGCSDDTAAIARRFGDQVRVIETEVASKVHALNLGDAAATSFPRIYMDADVVVTRESILKIAAALDEGPWLAAAPRPADAFLPETGWAVRAYYRFWAALPYIEEGMIAAGVYALSEKGRARFKDFPDVIADDGYVRLLFESHERTQVGDAVSTVYAPTSLSNLLKIRTRSRLGGLQLQRRYPELARRETRSKGYGSALLKVARQPTLYPAALPYLYVAIVSLLRARKRQKQIDDYVWERDESSRALNGAKS